MIFLHIFLTSTYLAISFRKWTMVRAGGTGWQGWANKQNTLYYWLPPQIFILSAGSDWLCHFGNLGSQLFHKREKLWVANSKCGRPNFYIGTGFVSKLICKGLTTSISFKYLMRRSWQVLVKFRYSKKATKFWKISPQFCVLLRISEPH